jgi:hypothetical protein
MEKYGFVYIWYDRKHKRYYVGSHWGYENDRYVCSSGWMNRAYKNRPNDFKRRIIKKVEDRTLLLEEEHKWLSMIKATELKIRYYNLRNHAFGHWSSYPDNVKSISEKISIRTKEAMNRNDVRENYVEGLKKRNTRSSEVTVREKRRQSMIGKNVGKDNSKAIAISAEMRRGKKLSEDHKNKIRETSHFAVLNTLTKTCDHCGYIGSYAAIGRYHNDRCKVAHGS